VSTGISDLHLRRRRWPLVLPLALVLVLAIAWSGFWYYAAAMAESKIADLRARGTTAGYRVDCGRQTIGGFPFRIEVRCGGVDADVRPAAVKASLKDLVAAVQIYQPTLVLAELTGPLTLNEGGAPPAWRMNWTLAQASLRGLPGSFERLSLAFDKPDVAQLGGPAPTTIARAEHLEAHARQTPRLPQDPPAIDIAFSFAKATLPGAARIPDRPIDGDIAATLHGLKDFAPRPLARLARDLQAANGRLDIAHARVQQGEIIADGQGTLTLTPRGMLDGQIQLTVAGLEQLMTLLGIDKAVGQASQRALDRLAPGLNLDRLLGPRGNAAIAAAGVSMLGQPAELEGRQAIALPLRFADGVIFLGPLRVGEMQPLF
jgi:hypothetical protein